MAITWDARCTDRYGGEWHMSYNPLTQTTRHHHVPSGRIYEVGLDGARVVTDPSMYEAPNADVARVLGLDPPKPRPAPPTPEPRDPEAMMRLITKLSLLWEKKPGLNLTTLIRHIESQTPRGKAYYGAEDCQDDEVEAAIDIMLARP